jgi:hypothetical protein
MTIFPPDSAVRRKTCAAELFFIKKPYIYLYYLYILINKATKKSFLITFRESFFAGFSIFFDKEENTLALFSRN